jgi:5-methylcytosine-specific restriction endonuclease McrA
MKLCPKCETEHLKPGVFCSRKCANSRTWTDAQKKERSKQLKEVFSSFTKEELKQRSLKGSKARSDTAKQRLLSSDTKILGPDGRRKLVLLEQDYKCNKCGLTDWQGNPISLELDHIDGNKKNNDRLNLECLCPNCHAQTPTWRGRNRKLAA